MGFEAFRVELRGGKSTFGEADEAVQQLPHVKPDPSSIAMKGSTYYVVDDGQHVIELEIMEVPVRLSCRFTLCHPPSVDAVFLALVRQLMLRLGMETKICDDVRPAHPLVALAEFPDFDVITRQYIAARRAEWIATFGDRPLAATTTEVYERIILPQCLPEVAQPT